MWTLMYETGYYTFRMSFYGNRSRPLPTNVHLILDGRPVCGYIPCREAEFRWRSNGIRFKHLECYRCREKAKKIILAASGGGLK